MPQTFHSPPSNRTIERFTDGDVVEALRDLLAKRGVTMPDGKAGVWINYGPGRCGDDWCVTLFVDH